MAGVGPQHAATAPLRRLQHHTRAALQAARELERYTGEQLGVYTVPAGEVVNSGDFALWLAAAVVGRPPTHTLFITVHSGQEAAEEVPQECVRST